MDTPCPTPPTLDYPDLGPELTATCEGTTARNGFYGDGIADALSLTTDTDAAPAVPSAPAGASSISVAEERDLEASLPAAAALSMLSRASDRRASTEGLMPRSLAKLLAGTLLLAAVTAGTPSGPSATSTRAAVEQSRSESDLVAGRGTDSDAKVPFT
jgi:hypothetical protein